MSTRFFVERGIYVFLILALACNRDQTVVPASDALADSVKEIESCVVPLVAAAPGAENRFEIRATAFFIHPEGLLLTAAHAVTADKLYVVYNGNILHTQVVIPQFQVTYSTGKEDSTNQIHKCDMAVLGVKKDAGPYPSVRLSQRIDAQRGEPVATLGFYESGSEFEIEGRRKITSLLTLGTISGRFDMKVGEHDLGDMLVIDVTAGPGSSGSPVFDPSTGEVRGIITEGEMRGIGIPGKDGSEGTVRIPLGLMIAEPIVYIRKWLEEPSHASH